MDHRDLTHELKKYVPLFMENNHCKSVKEINNGYCGDFAFLFWERMKKKGRSELKIVSLCDFISDGCEEFVEEDTSVWDLNKMSLYGITQKSFLDYQSKLLKKDRRGYVGYHVWLYDGNKHYDSQCLGGVSNPLELPFFKLFI